MKHLFFLILLAGISFAQTITYDSIQVNTGWNLIGALEDGAIVDIVSTTPPGIIITSFFGYSSGYFSEDSLNRGNGYWVKVSEPGVIQIQIPSTAADPCDGQLTVYYEGKTYNTLAIGSQCWLRENLDVGTMIPGSQDAANNGVIEKYCYSNDSVNCLKYGGLYQWDEAMQYAITPGSQGICPNGWHIPTTSPDYQTLSTTVGGNSNAIKAIGQGTGGGAGTNSSGLSVLLAGYRNGSSLFDDLGVYLYCWSSTEYGPSLADHLDINKYTGDIFFSPAPRPCGLSVRCIKD